MKILIYEPLADINKAPFFARLATQLLFQGNDVLIACEQKTIYTLNGKLTEQGVINCTSTICNFIAANNHLDYTCLLSEGYIYNDVTRDNLEQKLSEVTQLRIQFFAPLLSSFKPDLVYIWNGQAEHQQDFLELVKSKGIKIHYLEHGWFPQKKFYYIDDKGVNAKSSIPTSAPEEISTQEAIKLNNWLDEYTKKYIHVETIENQILVPLQVDTDTNITNHSPFKNMKSFVSFLEKTIPPKYRVIIRPHPLANYPYSIQLSNSNFIIDSHTELYELLASSEVVLGINSTVLLEALCFNKKVIPLGDGILKKLDLNAVIQQPLNVLVRNQHLPLLFYLIFVKQRAMPKKIPKLPASLSVKKESTQRVTFNKPYVYWNIILRKSYNLLIKAIKLIT